MRLSEEILESIVWSLAAKPPTFNSGIASENRRHPRSYAHGSATIYYGEPGMTRRVSIYDISADGVAIVSSVPMKVDDKFVLSLSKKAKTSAVICQVMHCSREPEHYRIGASFVRFA